MKQWTFEYRGKESTNTSLDGNHSALVLANGALVNIAGGLGHPIEIMDLSFAVQGVGCHELARGAVDEGVQVIDQLTDRGNSEGEVGVPRHLLGR